ncbi:D-2-hydroxyacid dehydrogenase [Halorussus gelatinilyticus]|uniref:D-2-hydroxyacid dehydrogenase n=1 Tax=Halorussus gelatinilyticus TaxID=2937524 RepID=A0A8U0IK11_9EURY|nr:D-2-hydroxyacid dehydrogenase [Halorussus gelatinilyticus]UPW00574.1 D-2-hydroxyacid dehydrogenase [Halorussus gelatinilyticus]
MTRTSDDAPDEDAPDVVVLRKSTHGVPVSEYGAELRERLPDRTVAYARTPTEERELVADAPVVAGMELDADLLEHAEAMELFACAYAGTGHLPLDALEDRGVAVTNASGVHGPNIGEHVVGNLLVFARRLHEGWRRQRNREWRHFRAHELQDSTVTVVGLGAIGRSVVERLQGFGVETVGVRYTPEKGGPTDEVVGFEGPEFEDALARTDYLVLACPLTETTRGLIGKPELKTLPPDAVLVNVARGPVVDTDALVWALRGSHLRGAALDVTDPEPLPEDHPLWNFENCLITPHCSGHTPEYYSRLADIVADNVRRLDDGEELRNRVV